MSFLHCAADGSAKVLDADAALSDDVAVLPYEDGMKVVVRAALANGVKRCATVTVAGMTEGETRWIVNLAVAGKGAKVVSCVVKGGLEKAKSHAHVAAEMPIVGSAPAGDGGSERRIAIQVAQEILKSFWQDVNDSHTRSLLSASVCVSS